MFARDAVWEHLNLNWVDPIEPGTVVFNNTSNGATGTLEIVVEGWYYVKICGGGASSMMGKNDNAGSGSGGAAFMGEIFLPHGIWNWQVGAKGAAQQMEAGKPSSLINGRNKNLGIIAGPGLGSGFHPNPGAQGGVLEQKNIRTRNVTLASNGNPGFPGYYGGYQTQEAQSVLKPLTGEDWGKGGSGRVDTAKQGILYIEFRGM